MIIISVILLNVSMFLAFRIRTMPIPMILWIYIPLLCQVQSPLLISITFLLLFLLPIRTQRSIHLITTMPTMILWSIILMMEINWMMIKPILLVPLNIIRTIIMNLMTLTPRPPLTVCIPFLRTKERSLIILATSLIRSILIINLFLFFLFCYTPIHILNKQRNKSYIFSVKGEL